MIFDGSFEGKLPTEKNSCFVLDALFDKFNAKKSAGFIDY
jgi:hypothetical protein